MKETLHTPERPDKGMSLEECIERADVFINRNGVCLLVMDIIGSGKFPDRAKLHDDYAQLLADLNAKFEEHLPQNTLTNLSRVDQGFNMVIGDGATGAIDDSTIIEEVMSFAREHPTQLPLRYAVAEDGYDTIGVQILK